MQAGLVVNNQMVSWSVATVGIRPPLSVSHYCETPTHFKPRCRRGADVSLGLDFDLSDIGQLPGLPHPNARNSRCRPVNGDDDDFLILHKHGSAGDLFRYLQARYGFDETRPEWNMPGQGQQLRGVG